MSIARIIATLAVAALLPAAAARAEFNAGSETVAAGAVSATLSWDRGEVGPANMTLTISRGGAVAFRQAIPRACGAPCQRFAGDGDDFRLTELDGDGEPEVLVASSNLEECCETIGIYGFQAAAGTYDELVRTFEIDPDIEDLDRDGRSELVTRDLRFRDLVGGDFGAWLPPVVLAYERRGGAPALADVTRSFPALIRRDAADARRYFKSLRRHSTLAESVVAGYVADQYLLGRGSVGLRALDRQVERGILGGPEAARAYRRRVLAFLRRVGYR